MFENSKKLPTFEEVKNELPLSKDLERVRAQKVDELNSALNGNGKLVAIVGACSADNERAIREYCIKLSNLSQRLKDKLVIVPRIFTAKPRTKSGEYQGMFFCSEYGKKIDIPKGIYAVRKLYLDVLNESALIAADELLYLDNYFYYDDLVGYLTIGARSAENQQHKLFASGVSQPIGIKNAPSGVVSSHIEGVITAQKPQTLAFGGWQVRTSGNSLAHAILRGRIDGEGKCYKNFLERDFEEYSSYASESGLGAPALMVDLSHANSGKNALVQCDNLIELGRLYAKLPIYKKLLRGFMLESYLNGGKSEAGNYGQSVTDECLSFDETQKLLLNFCDLI